MARMAAVVIRGPETRNRNSKLRNMLQQVRPVVFEFLVGVGVPDLYGFSNLEQVIDVPMRGGSRFQVMADARFKPARSESTSDVSITTGHDVKFAQSADGNTLHLRHERN